jgi:hypothetical protein
MKRATRIWPSTFRRCDSPGQCRAGEYQAAYAFGASTGEFLCEITSLRVTEDVGAGNPLRIENSGEALQNTVQSTDLRWQGRSNGEVGVFEIYDILEEHFARSSGSVEQQDARGALPSSEILPVRTLELEAAHRMGVPEVFGFGR